MIHKNSSDFLNSKVTLYGGYFVFLILLIGRVPNRLLMPSLFNEDGTVYFTYAYEHNWLDALVQPHQGYYSLWPNLVTVIAANLCPLLYVPVLVALAGIMIWLLMALLVVMPGSPFSSPTMKVLALWLMVLVPPAEGRFSLNYTHFYVCVIAMLVLISENPLGKRRWGYRVLLLFSGLCGPVAGFLIPVYAFSAYKSASKERWMQLFFLSAGTLPQFYIFISTLYQQHFILYNLPWGRFHGIDELDVMVFWLVNRSIIHPLLGTQAMVSIGNLLASSVAQKDVVYGATLVLSLSALFCWLKLMYGLEQHKKRDIGLFLLLAFIIVSLCCFFLGSGSGETLSKMRYITIRRRYFVPQSIFMAFALLINAFEAKVPRYRMLYGTCIGVMIITGFYMWTILPEKEQTFTDWQKEITLWRKDPSRTISIMPEHEYIYLNSH